MASVFKRESCLHSRNVTSSKESNNIASDEEEIKPDHLVEIINAFSHMINNHTLIFHSLRDEREDLIKA
jgi:hypothetical protein